MKARILLPVLGLVLALVAACGGGGDGQSNDARGLETAAKEFAEAFFGGDTSAAYDFLSAECKEQISSRDFRDSLRAAEALFEVFAGIKFEDLEVDEVTTRDVEDGRGEALVVFKEIEDAGFDLNDDSAYDEWVYEDGGWRMADCESFLPGDGGDDSTGDSDSGSDGDDSDSDTGRTGPGSSRNDPAPLGTVLEVAGWEIVVNGTTPDATEEVLAFNEFNDPPPDGSQYFLVNLTATYVGNGEDDSASIFFSLDFGAVGASSVAYDQFEDNCNFSSLPDELDDDREVFAGGSVTGNICWTVDETDVDSLLLFVDESFGTGEGRAWFDLR